MKKKQFLSGVISKHLVMILAFKLRNPNTANPKPN